MKFKQLAGRCVPPTVLPEKQCFIHVCLDLKNMQSHGQCLEALGHCCTYCWGPGGRGRPLDFGCRCIQHPCEEAAVSNGDSKETEADPVCTFLPLRAQAQNSNGHMSVFENML